VDRDPPDAVVVDIRMPPTFSSEGLEAAQTIRTRHPRVGVLVLSQHVDAAYAMRLVSERSERVGYLLKDRIADVAALVDALRRVRAGETVVDPELVSEGRIDRGIAEALWLSPKTVETHVRTILRKLDLPTSHAENRRVHAVLTFLGRNG
jgi:DNA-binding NarL/FixJ family response regulator